MKKYILGASVLLVSLVPAHIMHASSSVTTTKTVTTTTSVAAMKATLSDKWKAIESTTLNRMDDTAKTRLLTDMIARVNAMLSAQKSGTDMYELLSHLKGLIQNSLNSGADKIIDDLLNNLGGTSTTTTTVTGNIFGTYASSNVDIVKASANNFVITTRDGSVTVTVTGDNMVIVLEKNGKQYQSLTYASPTNYSFTFDDG